MADNQAQSQDAQNADAPPGRAEHALDDLKLSNKNLKTTKKRKTPDSASLKNTKTTVEVKGKAEIFPDKPMPDFDISEDIKAYEARGIKGGRQEMIGIVCAPHLVPRIIAAETYSALLNTNICSLVDHDVVYWPLLKKRRRVFVYRTIPGKRILKDDVPQVLGWKTDQALETIVNPMVNILQDFRDKDFVHGSIRPSNMFVTDGEGKNKGIMTLGDCLTAPVSYTQPVLYEPIHRAMADPIGRGLGTLSSDLYSFGVSLAVILRSNDSLAGMSDEEVIKAKIQQGSYTAVIGKDRFKGAILELLRGILHDDENQRWTVEDVLTWHDGRRLTPKQTKREKKAQRPISFGNRKFSYMSSLSMAMHNDIAGVQKLIETDVLEQWVSRSLEDEEALERIEKAQKSAKEGGVSGERYLRRLSANLSMALDPEAPARYGGISMRAEAFGKALAKAMVQQKDINVFAEMIEHNIMMNWVAMQKSARIDKGALIGKLDSCRNYLRQTKAGFGIERCAYTLCPELHCLSPKLKGYQVVSPEGMLDAFEDMCANGKAPSMFLDRHSIAFLSVKDSQIVDNFLFDLDSSEPYRKISANLKCLAIIKKRGNLGDFPNIASAFLDILPAVYERYHDREVQKQLEKAVRKHASTGDLVKMASVLDNPDLPKKDLNQFRMAMADFKKLQHEEEALGSRMVKKEGFAKETSKQVTAVIACLLSAVVIIITAIAFMSDSSSF